ncbi:MAG: glycosyltransferase family 2 protein [Candidatus Omnitrophota bacterium]|nr:MAG: glycosyltransferase family 2 protein [Candidatus Omnitrophota bacterium]
MNNRDVEVSVVIPCLNEAQAIGGCIEKVKHAFVDNNINGEIVVVDNNSTDNSSVVAHRCGGRVVFQPIKGYGAAYIKGLEEARGRYIIIGDGDNSYDFAEIPRILKFLKDGYDFVIGSRFKGKIHKHSMPWINRYVGNPVLSGLCRLFFRTKLSDIHCGMRAFTKEAYKLMNLKCLGMEFATEMVMEALQKKLKIKEIPIDYHPRKGDSKLRPLKDAWRHIRFMLLFCPTWLYLFPGLLLTVLGVSMLLALMRGPVLFLGHSWDIHIMVLFSLLSILGYQLINLGMYAKTFAVQQGYIAHDRTIASLTKYFRLESGVLAGFLLFIIGLGISLFIFIEWWNSSFGPLFRIRESILAMTFMVLGLQTIFSSFFISLLIIRR